jgi:hypothetical protein
MCACASELPHSALFFFRSYFSRSFLFFALAFAALALIAFNTPVRSSTAWKLGVTPARAHPL